LELEAGAKKWLITGIFVIMTPYEKRNLKAIAEGYKSYYDKRIQLGLAKGLSKSQAAGKPNRGGITLSFQKRLNDSGNRHTIERRIFEATEENPEKRQELIQLYNKVKWKTPSDTSLTVKERRKQRLERSPELRHLLFELAELEDSDFDDSSMEVVT
jgi:hypothetical protein